MGVTDSVIYDLEITRLQTQEKVSLPCFLLPGDDPEKQIAETLRLLHTFVQLTSDFLSTYVIWKTMFIVKCKNYF